MPWVLDLDGVVWLADDAIPGAADAVARLRAAGERLVFVTNMSFAPVREVATKLAGMGIDAGDDVVTSAMAAAALVEPGERVLVVGGPGIVEAIEGRDATVVSVTGGESMAAGTVDALDTVDAVLVGYDPAFDYARMAAATTAVRAGARLLATNDDATYPTPRGLLPGGGAILASIERASGRRATVAGKPHQPICDLVRARLGPSGTVVGDRPDTDGRFAEALGYRFALVLSGVTGKADLPVSPAPALVATDLAALVDQALA